MKSQNYRFRLEGTSPEHLVQPHCSSRVSYSRVPRAMSNWVWGIISTDGDLHNPSGQYSQSIVFRSFLHPASQPPPQHPQVPQAVDSAIPFCHHARFPPLIPTKSCSENPGPHQGETEVGGSPLGLAPVVQGHRCGRAQRVRVPAPHGGSNTRYGCCVKSKRSLYAEVLGMNTTQYHLIWIAVVPNAVKKHLTSHSETCRFLRVKNEAVGEKTNKFWAAENYFL